MGWPAASRTPTSWLPSSQIPPRRTPPDAGEGRAAVGRVRPGPRAVARGGRSPASRDGCVPYGNGLALDRYEPAALADDAPVVVLVHGCCGDRRDTAMPALARRGALVLNPDVGALAEGGGWPASYEAVACAVLTAGAVAGRLAGGPHPVALVGWSEGRWSAPP